MEKGIARIVKFDNQLNTLELGKLNAVELDLFMGICAIAKEKGTEDIQIPFDAIKQMCSYSATQKKRFVSELTQTNKKLMSLDFAITNEDKTCVTQFVLFPTFKTDINKKMLTVKVNSEFAFLLNDLTSNFTRFELKEYTEMRSKYSKILYQILKQYRKTGILVVKIEEFRKMLDIPEGYRMSEIDKYVLNPALAEIEQYFKNLVIKKEKGLKNKVTHIHFYFQKETGENIGKQREYKKRQEDAAVDVAYKNMDEKEDLLEKGKYEVPVFEEPDFVERARRNPPTIDD